MLNVIYSQFGATNEDSDPMNGEKITNPDSSAMKVGIDDVKDTLNPLSPVHMSMSPEIINQSHVRSLPFDSPLDATCTEHTDKILISESFPNSLDNETSFIVPVHMPLSVIQNSENIASIGDIFCGPKSQTDPDDKKCLTSFCVSLSRSVSTEPLEVEIQPKSAHQGDYDSDDLVTSSPLTPYSKVTLSSQTKNKVDGVSVISSTLNVVDERLDVLVPNFHGIDEDTSTSAGDVSRVMFPGSMMICDDFPHLSSVINEATPIEADTRNQLILPKFRQRKLGTFQTPLEMDQFHLQTDEDITPMPDYRSMVTPALKERCFKFGVKPLAKRKMISKLEEIYDYTHPLIGRSIITHSTIYNYVHRFLPIIIATEKYNYYYTVEPPLRATSQARIDLARLYHQ